VTDIEWLHGLVGAAQETKYPPVCVVHVEGAEIVLRLCRVLAQHTQLGDPLLDTVRALMAARGGWVFAIGPSTDSSQPGNALVVERVRDAKTKQWCEHMLLFVGPGSAAASIRALIENVYLVHLQGAQTHSSYPGHPLGGGLN
jgi:hypothetical protein